MSYKIGDKVRIRQELIFAQYGNGDYDTIIKVHNGLYGLLYFDQETEGDNPWLDNSAKWNDAQLIPYDMTSTVRQQKRSKSA